VIYLKPWYMSELNHRYAKAEDAALLFRWANDPEVRKASFHSTAITWPEHLQWLERRLGSGSSLLLIFEKESSAVGIVRFEIGEEGAIIGISIDEAARGQGYGKQMIEQACMHFRGLHQLPVLAYIKKDNPSSVRSFERAGFRFLQEDEVNGIPCFLYILYGNE